MKEFNKKIKKNRGMTYVELIVVLSIFGIMSSVVLFNYRDFNSQMEIKSLANDIALKIVQVQKDAMSGKLAPIKQQQTLSEMGIIDWKPSYGLYFNTEKSSKSFVYFADLDGNFIYNKDTSGYNDVECIDEIKINSKYSIGKLTVYCPIGERIVNNLAITFTRPDSVATIVSYPDIGCLISSAVINVTDGSINNNITVYSSGRIQIK